MTRVTDGTALTVVQVTPYYKPHLGGVEIVAENLGRELVARGHNVTTVTTTLGGRCVGLRAGAAAFDEPPGRMGELPERGTGRQVPSDRPSLAPRWLRGCCRNS